MISKIGQLAITVSDVDQALRFYRDVLGLEFLFSASENLAFLKCGETRLMLSTPQGGGEVGKNSIAYFYVENIVEFYQQLVSDGAQIEREPTLAAEMTDHQLWIGFLKDPDDNLLAVMEEIPK